MSRNAPKWNVESARSGDLYYVVREDYSPGEIPIAIVLADERENADALSNARLMAAAPDMLSAIRYAIATLDHRSHDSLHMRAITILNEALDRAERRQ